MSFSFETILNLNNQNFIQLSNETLNLSGITNVFGSLCVKPIGIIDSFNGYKLSGDTFLDSSPICKSSIFLGVNSGSNNRGCNEIAIGYNSLYNSTANSNIAIGCNSLCSNTTGINNIGIGSNTLLCNVTSSCNIAIGNDSLRVNDVGSLNIGIGNSSLCSNTSGNRNIGLGYGSLSKNTIGCCNIGIGDYALYCNVSGNTNIGIGSYVLYCNRGGIANTGIGYLSLYNNTFGSVNNAFGYQSLYSNRCGNDNNAFGCGTLKSNIDGCHNIAIGTRALFTNTCGNNNIGIGSNALSGNTLGLSNVGIGYNSLQKNLTGCYNLGIGENTLCCNTTGCYNMAFGYNALLNNNTGCNNVGIGYNILRTNSNGCNNLGLGYNVLYNNTSGCNNIALGFCTLCCNTIGLNNIGIGYGSLRTNTDGSGNISIGCFNLYCNTSGSNNVSIGTCAGYAETGSNKFYVANNATCNLIYGEFDNNIITLPKLKLCETPTTGAGTDSLLVWNSTDKCVKKIANNTIIGGLVTGATSSTDNAIARFDGITGKLIQNSGIVIDDSGNITMSSKEIKGVGIEIVSSLPTTNNFTGRQVTYLNRTYIWNGSTWISDTNTFQGYDRCTFIQDNAVIMNTNPFGGRKLYINSVDNAMFAADKRFSVTVTKHLISYGGETYPKLNPDYVSSYSVSGSGTNFVVAGAPTDIVVYIDNNLCVEVITPTTQYTYSYNSGVLVFGSTVTGTVYVYPERTLQQYLDSPVSSTVSNNSAVFDGSYESTFSVNSGYYLKIKIDASTNKVQGFNELIGYPYGNLYISYYYNNTPDSAFLRVYNRNYRPHTIGWKYYTFQNFINNNTIASFIQKVENTSDYGRTSMEFIIISHSSHSTGVTEIDWELQRPDLARTSPTVTKFGPQTLYYPLTVNGLITASQLKINSPITGAGADSILVWNSTDKYVKTISCSTINENNITSANNGLTKSAQNVHLGGALTGNTGISGAYTMGFNNTYLNLTGTSGVNISGPTKLLTTPANGVNTDSLLVWNSSDKTVKSICKNLITTGLVTGSTSSTDNAIARFDGTTGKLIQNSGIIIDDNGNMGFGITPTAKLNIGNVTGSSIGAKFFNDTTICNIPTVNIYGFGRYDTIQRYGTIGIDDYGRLSFGGNSLGTMFMNDLLVGSENKYLKFPSNGRYALGANSYQKHGFGSGMSAYLYLGSYDGITYGQSADLIIGKNQTYDYGHPYTNNPTIYLHSKNNSQTEYISVEHNGNNAILSTGVGSINLVPFNDIVNISGTTTTDYLKLLSIPSSGVNTDDFLVWNSTDMSVKKINIPGGIVNTVTGHTQQISNIKNIIVTGATSSTDNAIARFDGTTGKLIQNSGVIIDDNGNMGFGITPTAQITQTSTAALESAPLGTELLTSSNWTTTGWTGDFVNGFTHTTGNVTPLTNTLAALNATLYQIAFTVTNRTAGSFTVTFGNETSNRTFTATDAWGVKTTGTGTFSIVPTTDFNGTIVISIKRITGTYNASYQILDSAGISTLEIRSSLNTLNNTFIGRWAGRYNTTGCNNSAQGSGALYFNTTGYNNSAQGVNTLLNNTTGYNNSAQGSSALQNNTTGSYNSAQGSSALYYNTTGVNNSAQGGYALYSNTTGSNNSAQGYAALRNNTTGNYNSAQGYVALYSNTTGSNNSAQGVAALFNNTTGSYNSAQGYAAGRYLADGVTANQNSNNSVFLGSNTKSKQANQTNEIVIGNDAIGNGSNTVTLGHTTVTDTYLRGNIHLETPPISGLNTDSILVYNTSDCYVKSISVSNILSSAILTANNGLTKSGQNVHLGGVLTGNTGISGAYSMGFNNTYLNLTGTSGVYISGPTKLLTTPANGVNTDSLLVWNSSDKTVKSICKNLITTGLVTGSTSSTDNAIARFDGTTGKLIQNSGVIVDDNGYMGIGATPSKYKLDVRGGCSYIQNFMGVMSGEGFGDSGMIGILYDRNQLTNAAYRGTVNVTITGSGSYTNTVVDNNKMFNASGDFNYMTGLAADSIVEIKIEFPVNVNNYGSGGWQPFFQTRTSYSPTATFPNSIVVEISADNVNWYKPASGWSNDNFITNNLYGLWMGDSGWPGINNWRFARFILSDFIIGTTYGLWISQIGIRHKAAPAAIQFVSALGDDVYGNLNVYASTNTNNLKLNCAPATGVGTDNVLVWNSTDKCVKTITCACLNAGNITTANNGLNKIGSNVRLGGALTGDTSITGAYTLGLNNTILNLTGSSGVNISGPTKLISTPATGTSTDGILVWNSTDKCVKQVSSVNCATNATTAVNSTCLNGQLASYYAVGTHVHGNITNGGCLGTTSGCVLVTSAGGCIVAASSVGCATSATNALCLNGQLASYYAIATHAHGNITNTGCLGTISGCTLTTDTNGCIVATSFVNCAKNAANSINATTANNSTCLNGQLASYYAVATHGHGNITNAGCLGTVSGCTLTTDVNGCIIATSFVNCAKNATTANNSTCLNGQLASYYAVGTHVHGNITNTGCIGSASGCVLVTTTGGLITTASSVSCATNATTANNSTCLNGQLASYYAVASNVICSANNGLNKIGTNVRLGGALTGNTTVSGAYTMGFSNSILNLTGSTCVNISGPTKLLSTPASGLVTDSFLVWNSTDKTIKIVSNPDTGEANTASNLGTGNGIYASKSGVDLRFKSLIAGTSITMTPTSNDITINTTAEANTASNLGTGYQIYASKSGADLRFKSLLAGSNVTMSCTANDITINANAGLTTANNGLNVIGSNVRLGGTLTGNTGISGAYTMGFSNTILNLTGSTCVNISGPTKLLTTPTAGTGTDGILVWNSTDKTIKQVSSVNCATNANNSTCLNGQLASYYAIGTHVHGNITNGGSIGTVSGCTLTTDTNGCIIASSFVNCAKNATNANNSTCLNGQLASYYAIGTHVHGNITNTGYIGSASGCVLVTTTSGLITTASSVTCAANANNSTCLNGQLASYYAIGTHVHGNITNTGCIGAVSGCTLTTDTNGCIIATSFVNCAKNATNANNSTCLNGQLASYYAIGTHAHGSITNTGYIGSASGCVLVTTTGGLITTASSVTCATNATTANNSTCLNGQLASYYAVASNVVCSANNGLTKSGSNVRLGGTLTGNTGISGAYTMGFSNSILNLTGSTCVNISGPTKLLSTPSSGLVTDSFLVWNSTDKTIKIVSNPDTGEANTASNLGTGYQIFASKVGVDLRFKSFLAGTNVTMSCTANDITINANAGLTTANNGLNAIGSNVRLGGALTGNTGISGAYTMGFNNSYLNLTGTSGVNISGPTKLLSTPVSGIGTDGILVWNSTDKTIKQVSSVSCATNATTANNSTCLNGQLASYYAIGTHVHGNITNGGYIGSASGCVLVTTTGGLITTASSVACATNATTANNSTCLNGQLASYYAIASNTISTANNGLTKSGSNVRLGGTLTGNTGINGAYTMGFSNSILNLTGSTCVNISGPTKLLSTPSTGVNTDDFLVWNSTDKCVKKINISGGIVNTVTGHTQQISNIKNIMVTGTTSSTDNAIVRFDGTTGKLIQNSGIVIDDNNYMGFGITPTAQITQTSTAALESAPLGSELLTSSNWTTTGWIGDFVNGFTHTTGNVTPLTNTLAALNATLYQIAFTVTNRTAGNFTVTFGNETSGAYSSSNAWGVKTTGTGTLSITPTTHFNGTIVISIKRITGTYNATYQILDSAGISTLEIRSSLNTLNNTFIGKGAGGYNTTGSYNSAQGFNALYYNTTGSYNSAQGFNALYYNTTGSNNNAQGVNALYSNITGCNNSAQGSGALYSNTTGNNNSTQGVNALYSNTTGNNNSAQGVNALFNNTTGSNNSAQGYYALFSNTIGNNNSAQGYATLQNNTTGYNNSAQGVYALLNNTTGSYNSAQGVAALYYNTTGSYNSAQGGSALNSNTTGSNNSAQGYYAGLYLADGVTANQNSNNSVFLGSNTKSKQANQSNEIVIGYDAIGNGSNTATIGHTTVTDTYLRGNIHLETAPSSGAGTDGILVWNSTDKTIKTITCACLNTSNITTANNGLTKSGSNVRLGGALTGNTTITGAYTLSLCSGALLNTQCGYQISGNTILKTHNASMTSIFLGCNVGVATGSTYYNTGMGGNVMCNIKNACFNSGFGNSSLRGLNYGCNNVAIGNSSQYYNYCACNNVAIGSFSLRGNVCGCSNTAIGTDSLYSHQNSFNNIAIGCGAAYSLIDGNDNIIIGNNAACNLGNISNKLIIANTYLCNLIYGDFTGNTVTLPKLKLCETPSTGAAGDCYLVWNSTDKCIKLMSGGTGGSGILTANNGLNVIGSNVRLGGTLTGNTGISGAYTMGFSNSIINLTGSTCVNISGPTKLLSTPSSGAGTDGILVWNSTDKTIKQVSSVSCATNATTAVNSTCLNGQLASYYAIGTHVHGNITNTGYIGSASGCVLVTTTGGLITTASSVACATNATTAVNSTCLNGQLASYYAIGTHVHGNITNGGCLGTTSGCVLVTSTGGCIVAASSVACATNATTANNSTCLNGQLASYYAIGTHVHGNITNTGYIGSASGCVLVTTTGGLITTASSVSCATNATTANNSTCLNGQLASYYAIGTHVHGNISNTGCIGSASGCVLVTTTGGLITTASSVSCATNATTAVNSTCLNGQLASYYAVASNVVCSANNGLTKSGSNVRLGGALTGNTSITGAYTLGLNNTYLNLTGTSGVYISGPTKLLSTPATGTGTDSILVWNSTDKCIKAIANTGEANTASNLGTGNGIYASKVGVDLRFKSLKAGNNISMSSDSNEITICSTGGGSASASNGLSIVGSNITLGGTLTGDTLISGNNYDITLCSGNFNVTENYFYSYNNIPLLSRFRYNTSISLGNCNGFKGVCTINIGNNVFCSNEGSYDIGIGNDINLLSVGGSNVVIGNCMSNNIDSAFNNLFFGNCNVISMASGMNNLLFGNEIGNHLSMGDLNIILGSRILSSSSADFITNIIIGNSNIEQTIDNVFDNILIGSYIANGSQGCYYCNIMIGNYAGGNSTTNDSIFIGNYAGYNETNSGLLVISNNQNNKLIYGDFNTNIITFPTVSLCNTPETGSNTDTILTWNSVDWKIKGIDNTIGNIWTKITATRTSNTTVTVSGNLTPIFKKGMFVSWKESGVVKVAMVSIPSTYSSPNTTITLVGDTCASIDAGSFKYTNYFDVNQFKQKFVIAGNIGATATNAANVFYADEPYRVLGSEIYVDTIGTTNSTTVNLVKTNGTVTLTSPSLTTDAYNATPTAPASSGLSLALNDKVQLNITAVHTTIPSVGLYVHLLLFPTRLLELS